MPGHRFADDDVDVVARIDLRSKPNRRLRVGRRALAVTIAGH